MKHNYTLSLLFIIFFPTFLFADPYNLHLKNDTLYQENMQPLKVTIASDSDQYKEKKFTPYLSSDAYIMLAPGLVLTLKFLNNWDKGSDNKVSITITPTDSDDLGSYTFKCYIKGGGDFYCDNTDNLTGLYVDKLNSGAHSKTYSIH